VKVALLALWVQVGQFWVQFNRLESFFADAEHRLEDLPEDERVNTMERLRGARKLIGSIDALERLQSWKTPEER
jgi:hypothetical protein